MSKRAAWYSVPFVLLVTGAASAGPASLLRDIQPGPGPSTFFDPVAELDGKLLFLADDGVHGLEPWISDGTEDGTRLVRDVRVGDSGSGPDGSGLHPHRFTIWQGRAYFGANDGVGGFELWATDGTEQGTARVLDVMPGPEASSPLVLAGLDSLLVFAAYDGEHGTELWATDGTEGGTRLVRDLNPGPNGSLPFAFARLGDAVIFGCYADLSLTLWRTDGTDDGTFPLPVPPGDFDVPIVHQGALWFITYSDAVRPSELWRSDGTVAGTERVADLGVKQSFSLTVAGETLFFVGWEPTAGYELWASDWTGPGTHRVRDLWPGGLSSGVSQLTAVGETLFFTAQTPGHGHELWKSDGTDAGTAIVREIVPGSQGSTVGELREVAGVLLFAAFDDEGFGVWRSDGTEGGTFPVERFADPRPSTGPREFLSVGRRVYFTAYDPSTGREPWKARAAILTHQPGRALQDLGDEVRALGLPPGLARSLTAKLAAAEASLSRRGGERSTLRLLDAFASEVRARTPSEISDAAASDLQEFAEEIAGLLDPASLPIPARAFPAARSSGRGPLVLEGR